MALVPLPAATSSTRMPGLSRSLAPSRSVSARPPGWSESPSRSFAHSLWYAVAQQVLTSSGSALVCATVSGSIAISLLPGRARTRVGRRRAVGLRPRLNGPRPRRAMFVVLIFSAARATRTVVALKAERDRLRRISLARAPGAIAAALAGLELLAGLLPVAERVVCAEGDLHAAREQELLAAFHQVLLVKGPGVHEVLQHDHEDLVGEGAEVEPSRVTR